MEWNLPSQWSHHGDTHSLLCMYSQYLFQRLKKKEFIICRVRLIEQNVTQGGWLKLYLNLRATFCFSWYCMCLSGKFYVWGSGRRWWPSPLNAYRWLIFKMLLAFFQAEAWPLDNLNVMVAICKTDESRNSKRKWETEETPWNSLQMKTQP